MLMFQKQAFYNDEVSFCLINICGGSRANSRLQVPLTQPAEIFSFNPAEFIPLLVFLDKF